MRLPQFWFREKRSVGPVLWVCLLVSTRGRPSGTPGGDKPGSPPPAEGSPRAPRGSQEMSMLKNKQTYINHSRRAGAGLQNRSKDLAWHRIAGHACLRTPTDGPHLYANHILALLQLVVREVLRVLLGFLGKPVRIPREEPIVLGYSQPRFISICCTQATFFPSQRSTAWKMSVVLMP